MGIVAVESIKICMERLWNINFKSVKTSAKSSYMQNRRLELIFSSYELFHFVRLETPVPRQLAQPGSAVSTKLKFRLSTKNFQINMFLSFQIHDFSYFYIHDVTWINYIVETIRRIIDISNSNGIKFSTETATAFYVYTIRFLYIEI